MCCYRMSMCRERNGLTGGRQRGRDENTLVEGLSFFKKSVSSVASDHIVQCVDCFGGLLFASLERSRKWKFPSWNTRGSTGVTVQVRSLMNCICKEHNKTIYKTNLDMQFI